MKQKYSKLIEQQHLSEESKQAFYDNLNNTQKRIPQFAFLKTAVIAICAVLVLPITAYALESIWGINIVEIISGKSKTGYEVTYPDLASRPLSDISKEVQNIDGDMLVIYDSWEEAEENLGMILVENSILSGGNVIKEHSYNFKTEGYKNVHCFANYNGMNNQIYRATITAAYRYLGMQVILSSTVTCDHPSISDEEEYQFHWNGTMYQNDDIDEISQEEYTATNGIQATIVELSLKDTQTTKYEANFVAKGASYKVTITTYDAKRNDEAKANLIKILEGFAF